MPRRAWLRRSSAGLLGSSIAIAVLLPLRHYWACELVSIALVLTVPGLLALRALRVPGERIVEFPIYVPAASLFVLMAAGLACDLLGPPLGLSKPLHGEWTALSVIAASLLLWVAGLGAPVECRPAWPPVLSRPSLLLPLLVPALAAAGALLLTNHRGDGVARAAAFVTVLTLVFCISRADRLSRGQVCALIFSCTLAAEWGFELRSQEVIGFDVTTEIFVAQHTLAAGIWHVHQPHNAYGAMLSLTVLPSVLSSLTGCSPLVALKVLYPVIVALVPVAMFLIGSRFLTRRFAAVAAAVLVVQNYFFQGMPGLARQEIAILFFAALVAVLMDLRLTRAIQLRLVIGLSIGLVVSHYSSTYLAITILLVACVLQLLFGRRHGVARVCTPLLVALAVLAGGAAVWYAALTRSDSQLTSFVSSLHHDGLDLLPNSAGGIINSYLNGNLGIVVNGPTFEQVAVADYRLTAPWVHPLPAAFESRYAPAPAAVPEPPVRSKAAADAFERLFTLFSELMLLLAGVGSVVLLLGRRLEPQLHRLGILGLAAACFLAFIRFSGTGAAFYNQSRALAQSLIILALPVAWSIEWLFARLPAGGRAAPQLLAVVIGLVMAQQIGAAAVVVGGGTSLNLTQGGEDFERQYMTPAELAGARWVETEGAGGIIEADRYGQLRIAATDGRAVLTNLTPETIDRTAWVYGDRTNVVLGRARGEVATIAATYAWPASFLHDYFDTVFSDGDSRVYTR